MPDGVASDGTKRQEEIEMFRSMLVGALAVSLTVLMAAPVQAQWRGDYRGYQYEYDYRYDRAGRGYGRFGVPRQGRYGTYYRGYENQYDTPRYYTGPYRHMERAPLRIVRLLPNVAGRDEGREIITIYNDTNRPINLTGWWLQDRHYNRFPLRGVIRAGQAIDIRTDGSMPLNNGGDTVMIFDPNGNLIHSVSYHGDEVQINRPINF